MNLQKTEEIALHYEQLIRYCHLVTRYGVYGADIKVFRVLQDTYLTYNSEIEAIANNAVRNSSKGVEDILPEYYTRLGIITGYVLTALYAAQKNYETVLSDEQNSQLEQYMTLLERKTSIELLIKVIDSAHFTLAPLSQKFGVY